MQHKALKSPRILEYFKFKSKITAKSFVELLKDISTVDFSSPHPGQIKIIDAYDRRCAPSEESKAMGADFEYEHKVLTIVCGRRFGKSVVCSLFGAQELLIPNSKVLIVSYTLDNCRVIFDAIHKIVKGLGIKIIVERIQDMELELQNGSTIRVGSNDNIKSRLGTAVSLLIIDEAKLFARELYEQILKPMLLDYSPLSRTILISSPANGYLETYFERGQSTDPKWSKFFSMTASSWDNPTIPRDELEELKRTMDPLLYESEIMGRFTSSVGRVMQEFKKETCIFDPAEFPYYEDWLRECTIFQSIDGGYSHYFASTWFCYVEEIDTFLLFGEYMQNKTVTSKHAENIHAFEEEVGVSVAIRYADPASQQQNNDFSEYDLYYNKAIKATMESVNSLNSLFFQISAVTGRPRLLIHKDCTEMIRQLIFVQWKVGRDDQTAEKSSGTKPFMPDKDGGTDFDLFDSCRYGIHSFMKNNHLNVSVFSFGGDDTSEEDEFTNSMNRAGLYRM